LFGSLLPTVFHKVICEFALRTVLKRQLRVGVFCARLSKPR
jgi:hypothetical protein